MIKTIRNLFVCALCFISVISTGFGMWYFVQEDGKEAGISSSAVNVDINATADLGQIEFVPPTVDGFVDYGIALKSDFKNGENLYSGVQFMPSVRFVFSKYDLLTADKSVYYYFTFSSTSSFYAETDLDINGYLLFDTTKPGHGEENRIELVVRDEFNNFLYKTDENGDPVLDENNNLIRQVSAEFSPIFKYKSNMKPLSINEYKAMLNALNQNNGESTLTLHIITE